MNVVQEYRNPILIGVGGLVVAIVLWLAWISPQSSHLSDLNSQKTQLQSKVQSLNSQLVSLRTEKQQIPTKCAKLTKITTQIPSVLTPADLANEQATFFNQLTNIGTSSQVVIPTFGFGTTTSSPSSSGTSSGSTGVVPVPVTMTVTGTYSQMTSFISQLDSFPRLFTIQTFSLKLSTATGGGAGTGGGASGTSAPPLWVGGAPTPAGAGPYTLSISGDIYYTTAKNPLAACSKAEKLPLS
ncbi:MAG: type 4a pilus biogenesis protein PilO [Actinomycetota bacterium]|jgi:Tfp pilus assembly protein PilO|nr:type 4a pilus biogenesis protein PilO [Actinomycetota bacterium]